jgi:hypothetical protein
MPKIFEKDGYKFFFYSNEHRRYTSTFAAQVVRPFSTEEGVELRESQGLKVRELAKAEELAAEHRELIIQRWHEHINR